MTMKSIMPHLANHFVYFIEDNEDVHNEIRQQYRHLNVESRGALPSFLADAAQFWTERMEYCSSGSTALSGKRGKQTI